MSDPQEKRSSTDSPIGANDQFLLSGMHTQERIIVPESGAQGISVIANVAEDKPQKTGTLPLRGPNSSSRRKNTLEIGSLSSMNEGRGERPRAGRLGNHIAKHKKREACSRFSGNAHIGLDKRLENGNNNPIATELQGISLKTTVPPGQCIAILAEAHERRSLLAARCLLNCLSADHRTAISSNHACNNEIDVNIIDESCRGDASEMAAVATDSPIGKQALLIDRSSAINQTVLVLPEKKRLLLLRQKSRRKKVSLSISSEGASANKRSGDRHPRNSSKRRLPWRKEAGPAAERPSVTSGATVTDLDLAGRDDDIDIDDCKIAHSYRPPVGVEAASKWENEVAVASCELKKLGAAMKAIQLLNYPSPLHQELGLALIADGLGGPTALRKCGPERRCSHVVVLGMLRDYGVSPDFY